MQLTGLSIESYKPFRMRQNLEIRPITILIGKNNAGKSALARAPLLIGHALSFEAEAPLDLAIAGLDLAGSFADLVYARNPYGSVGLGAKFILADGKDVEFWAKIQHFQDYRTQIVTEFILTHSDGRTLTIKWKENEKSILSDVRTYSCQGVIQGEAVVSFSGLMPHFEDSKLIDVAEANAFVETIRLQPNSMVHLGPFREEPKRLYRYAGQLPRGLGTATGARAPQILGADLSQSRGIFEHVAEWYRLHMGDWSLELEDRGDTFSLVLSHPKAGETASISVVDAGQGIFQVLPLLVQHMYSRITGRYPVLEVIEQPELHLHPAAHAAVADVYITSVAQKLVPTRYVIETHSETFILRIRRRIAEGILDPNDVIIYSVDNHGAASTLATILVSATGDLSYWPEGVFSEDFEEVKKLRQAQNKATFSERPC